MMMCVPDFDPIYFYYLDLYTITYLKAIELDCWKLISFDINIDGDVCP